MRTYLLGLKKYTTQYIFAKNGVSAAREGRSSGKAAHFPGAEQIADTAPA